MVDIEHRMFCHLESFEILCLLDHFLTRKVLLNNVLRNYVNYLKICVWVKTNLIPKK